MGKSTKTFSFCSFWSFYQFANLTISFCQQNGQNGKIDKDNLILLILPFCLLYHFILSAEWAEWENRQRYFHSGHSASLLTYPFHSASRMGRMRKSTKTFSFCQFANFTISFCQKNGQNGQNGKIDKDIFILLILPFC